MSSDNPAARTSPRDLPSDPPSAACWNAWTAMWPYLDRELPPARHRAVVVHLAGCPECRERFAFNRAFLRAIRSSARGMR